MLLVMGTLVYNEILIIPCGLFKANTRAQLALREKEERGILDEDGPVRPDQNMNYIATSPAAVYDNSRNMRNLD